MKKLKFNSTLNHKQSDYTTHKISVEKVIMLYGKSFSELKDHPLRDNPYIAENRNLMYIDSNDTAHCLLMVLSRLKIYWKNRKWVLQCEVNA